jgi:glycosyltransferase involved in cell wall biosynthesis
MHWPCFLCGCGRCDTQPEKTVRILLVNTYVALHAGGQEKIVLDLANGLAESGCDVFLLSPISRSPALLCRLRADVHRLETPWEGLLLQEASHSALFRSSRRIIHRHGIDIVSGHGRMFGVYLAARLSRVPMFWTFHGADAPAYKSSLRFRLTARAFSFLSNDPNLRLVGVSEFVSRNLRLLFAAAGAERITTVVNGIADLDGLLALPPPSPKEQLRIGFVGRLEKIKGVWDLPALAGRLRERRVPFALTIFGSGSQRQPLAEAFHRAGFTADQVRFAGYQPDPLRIYSAVDVTVQLSRQEWLGSTIIESCAAARPVVAYMAGGNPEIVDDGRSGCLVPVAEVAAVAGYLERLWREPAVLTRMGQEARIAAAVRFAPGRMVRQYADLFRRALPPARLCDADILPNL